MNINNLFKQINYSYMLRAVTGLVLVMFSTMSCSIAGEVNKIENGAEPQEIHLNTGYKQYNLKKPDYRNNPNIQKDDDEGMPFEFITSPIQLLKHYQQENY